jgi:hypothetical protein
MGILDIQTQIRTMFSMTDGKGDAMPWSRVVIVDEPNPEAVRVVRDDLLDRFRTLYQAAGAPAEAAVYYRQLGEDHIYYFSPTASALAPELLRGLSGDSLFSAIAHRGI